MSDTTFADRLNELIYYYRLNKNSLSVKLGFTANTSITRLANHPDRNPSYDIIKVLMAAFPEVSGRWLILGEGKMLIADELQSKAMRTLYYKQEIGSVSPVDPDLYVTLILFVFLALKNTNLKSYHDVVVEKFSQTFPTTNIA